MTTVNTIISPMTYQVLTILLTLLFISKLHTASATTDRTYVKTACNSTTYPKICYNSLSPYASKIKRSPKKLSKTALSITIKTAHKATSQVSKLLKVKKLTRFEAALIKDCVMNIKDSIDGLKQSLHAIDHLSSSDKESDDQMDDIKTWVSAALTNENTCTDAFDDEGKKGNKRDSEEQDQKQYIKSCEANKQCLVSHRQDNNLKHKLNATLAS